MEKHHSYEAKTSDRIWIIIPSLPLHFSPVAMHRITLDLWLKEV